MRIIVKTVRDATGFRWKAETTFRGKKYEGFGVGIVAAVRKLVEAVQTATGAKT